MPEQSKVTRIFLCDLIHDFVKSSESYYVVPLNVGFVAAYCAQELASSVEIRIFKFPSKLEQAIKEFPPDILGFSFYTWNEELVRHFTQRTKQVCPETLVVCGGPNINATQDGLTKFFSKYSDVDFYIPYEGEETFTELVRNYQDRGSIGGLKQCAIPGTAFIDQGVVNYRPIDIKEKGKNIKTESLLALMEYFKDQEAEIETDVLIGLPSETFDSHMATLSKCFDFDIRYIRGMNIRLLAGTDMGSPEDSEEYGIKTKHRLIRDSYGYYWGDWVIDSEEIITSTSSMSEKEMIDLRLIHFFVWLFWNIGYLQPLLSIGRRFGENPLRAIARLALEPHSVSDGFSLVCQEYRTAAESEWFATKEELLEFYKTKSDESRELLEQFNYLNFSFSPKLVCDEYMFRSIATSVADYIISKIPSESRLIKDACSFTLDRVLGDPRSNVYQKDIEIPGKLFKVLVEESSIHIDSPYPKSESSIKTKFALESHSFLKSEIERFDDQDFSTALPRLVTNKFLKSLIFEPTGHLSNKHPERIKTMAGDTVS